jgi:hypothetical protein
MNLTYNQLRVQRTVKIRQVEEKVLKRWYFVKGTTDRNLVLVILKGFEGGQMPLQRRVPKFGFTNINRKSMRCKS